MSTKRLSELKNLTKEELKARMREAEAQLFQTKMKHTTGQLGNTGTLWMLRKDIARMKTLLSQGATEGSK